MSVKDNQGRFIACNSAFIDLFGISDNKAIIGKTINEIPELNDLQDISKIEQEVLTTTYEARTTLRLERKNYEFIYLVDICPTTTDNDKGYHVVSVYTDITDIQVQIDSLKSIIKTKDEFSEKVTKEVTGQDISGTSSAQNSVLYMKSFLENIIACMPGNVYWMDCNSVFLGCNDNVAKMLGLEKREDIVGMTHYDTSRILNWHKGQAESFRRDDIEVITSGEPKLGVEEPPIINAEGKTLYFLTSRVPIFDMNNKIVGVVGISIDITDRKEAEQLKLEKIAIEQKNAALREQIANLRRQASTIAHELRTPLGSILACASAIKSLINNMPDSNIRNSFETVYQMIKTETVKTNSFIKIIMENVKDLSNTTLEPISITKCVNDALDRFPYEDEQEREKINLLPGSDFTINGNYELMTHVLFNLIKNALFSIQAANKGKITIWTETGDSTNYLHVKDTGKGMSDRQLANIFKEFYSDTGVGTGIGLFFCRRVMDAFGGKISLC